MTDEQRPNCGKHAGWRSDCPECAVDIGGPTVGPYRDEKAIARELFPNATLRAERKALFENNRWQARKLDAVYQLALRWYEEEGGSGQHFGSAMLDVLNETADTPFYSGDIQTCAFTWRDDDKIIPETGYGSMRAWPEKITFVFDCGAIMACGDLSYAYLDKVLNGSGRVVALMPQSGADRVARKLADGLQGIAEWEAEHGALTDEEVMQAARLVKARDYWANFTTAEDKRVLGAIEAIPTRVLAQVADKVPAFVQFVKFELASRIAAAIVDVPWHWDDSRIQESSVHDLLDVLDSAERYGVELGAMTAEEKKRHYEAWVEGRVDDVTMQIRTDPGDGGTRPTES